VNEVLPGIWNYGITKFAKLTELMRVKAGGVFDRMNKIKIGDDQDYCDGISGRKTMRQKITHNASITKHAPINPVLRLDVDV
jgi:hypothetical protein